MMDIDNPWSIASINIRARPRPCKYCGSDLDRDHDNGCTDIALPINLRKRLAPPAPAKRIDDGTSKQARHSASDWSKWLRGSTATWMPSTSPSRSTEESTGTTQLCSPALPTQAQQMESGE